MEITGSHETMELLLVPAQRLLRLVSRLSLRQLTSSKRGPKPTTPKGHVTGSIARSHVATDRVIKESTISAAQSD